MYIIGVCGTHPMSDKSFVVSAASVCILSLYHPLTSAPPRQEEDAVPGCLKCS